MTKEISKREVILQKPFTNEYDVAHVVKEFKVTQYGVHVDDYDFHTSYFDSYDSKATAEKAKESREAWAYKMGDNKYFYVTTREVTVRRFFDIDMQKRNARKKLKSVDEFNMLSKRFGFTRDVVQLLAIGLYYPAKKDDLPPLTENYAERADKVIYIYLPKKDKYFLVFNPQTIFAQDIEVDTFDLNGAYIRWSNKSLIRPIIYDSKSDWELIEPYFDFEEAPEF